MTAPDTIDLFAGPGGWSVAAAALGLRELGIELDPWACATRAAAGHLTVRADVATLPTTRMRNKIKRLIGSPPCGTFSAAERAKASGTCHYCTRHSMTWRPDTTPSTG
ncbi:DNA cytosine methyltransferase [Catenulispora yoronensis]